MSKKRGSYQFTSILGPSGSGKTTLLNIIGGLDKYTSGDLVINGVSTKKYTDSNWDSYRNYKVGFVFQSYNLINHQSILSNVMLALTLSGVSSKDRREIAINALRKVGLADHIDKKPNELSGGQMQRVAIARALVNNPDIILADEPTGALDSNTSTQIMDLLKEVSKDRLVIMVTHNPELAEKYSNRIIRLEDGKIVNDTNPYKPNKKSSDSFIGKTSMSLLTSLSLSFNNLMTKKARTFLVSFAGAIGIIGIALIISLSTGVKEYINNLEEDMLSSYPLTITKESADITSMLLSYTSSDSDNDSNSDKVVEKQYIQTMFSNISTNDLKSFNNYIKSNKISARSVKYNYSVVPYIYTLDVNNNISRVNPSNAFSSFGSMGSMYSSYSSVYNQMINDTEKINEGYEILYGHIPQKYDEIMIVLPNKNEIPDLLVYSLGLRDNEELSNMINDIMIGKSTSTNNEPYEFTYEKLASLDLRVINQSDLYKYNSSFNVYEDMSDDEEYISNLYNGALKLKITAIVTAKDSTNMILNPGVLYTEELTKYIINNSIKSDIVKKQLEDKDINVMSGLSFDDKSNNSLSLSNMISVDNNLLKEAFNISISENDIKNTTNKYLNKIASNINSNIKPALNNYNILLTKSINMFFNNLLGDSDSKVIYENDISDLINNIFNDEEIINNLNELESNYYIGKEAYTSSISSLINNYISAYISTYNESDNSYTLEDNNMGALISKSNVSTLIDSFINNGVVKNLCETMAINMTNAVMQKNILTSFGEYSSYLIGSFSTAFNVDEKKIASAFKFNLNEEELKRIMTSMINNTEETYESNLIKLGYQDLDSPTSMSFYFDDFESKEEFTDFIKKYNDKVSEEKTINYTDTSSILMNSVKKIVNVVSYVLIAFVSVSLIVSSIMIAIITYISVLERIKEIGILRSIGASKKDIKMVFISETFIEGVISGVIGVVVTLILCIPINIIVDNLTGVTVAHLPLYAACLLILLSVILNVLAGVIPANIASKKDAVICLRSE